MKATWSHIDGLFRKFNLEIFDGVLPPITLKIGNGARMLGCFVHPRRGMPVRMRGKGECHIRISGRFDMDERVLEDTLIHEMIHYLIWIRGIDGESPHGASFHREMERINTTYSRNISVTGHVTAQSREADRTLRNNYICLTEWEDGRRMITVCARTRIFEIDRVWKNHGPVRSVEWFWSRDLWFNRFPMSRTPKAYLITEQEIAEHIHGNAVRCECDGYRFLPVRK